MYPSGLYLARKTQLVPENGSDALLAPFAARSVSVAPYCPVTNTLPLESAATPSPLSKLPADVPAICTPHNTAPVDEYLAAKASTFPLNPIVALLTPLELKTVSVPPWRPVTNTLPLESVASPYPMALLAIRAAHPTGTELTNAPVFATTDRAVTSLVGPNVPNIGNPLDP